MKEVVAAATRVEGKRAPEKAPCIWTSPVFRTLLWSGLVVGG